MKILFTIRSLTGGGAERVVSVLSGLLADVGEDVHIITYKTSERDYSISEKVQIHEMPQRKDSTITKGMRIFDMRKIIKEIQPDVIIPFVGTVLYVSWLAITGMKIPFVLTIRNNPWTMPEKRLLRNFRDYLAKKSCAILVQNEEQSEYFSADLRKKCFVVPNPLSSKFIDNHKEIYLLDEIEVRLSTDYLENKAELDALADKVVYTGPIDAYFDYKLGTLEYRSVRFETETLDKPNFQGNAAVNYTDRETPWTRIIEHKWFEFGKDENGNDLPKTIISREYSSEWKPGDEPYYPVNDAKNGLLYSEYKKLADAENNVIFGGRLGEYKYYDMDQVIAAVLDRCEKEF